ncbi:MAG TPA: aldo/keto reductase [Bryobacteraceae bacterium]|nr:aldo/keto reductase [Bryobacteraceae bacterium]
MPISRRDFLGSAALGAVAAPLVSAAGMPMRALGRTGTNVSILAFGGGSRFVQYGEEKGIQVLNHALDLGITYIDTADSYGTNGESQVFIGKVLKARGRKGLWLASKIGPRKYDDFLRTLDVSLKRLQVDHVDLLHIHALMGPDDLEAVSAKDGAYAAAVKARSQKMARFIGITCHAYPDVLKTALERHDFDCTQMALNAAMRGQVAGATSSFETTALPVALGKKMGVTAMKIFAQDALVGQAPPEKLIQYSMSLPVAATVIGMPKPEHLEKNIQVAKAFQPMPAGEMKRFSTELSAKNKMALDHFFRHHIDA